MGIINQLITGGAQTYIPFWVFFHDNDPEIVPWCIHTVSYHKAAQGEDIAWMIHNVCADQKHSNTISGWWFEHV